MATDPIYPSDADALAMADLERRSNAISFEEIPEDQLPWLDVRETLIARALAGHDCYAYRPAHQREYVIWDRQPDPAQESRFTPREWALQHGFLLPPDEPRTFVEITMGCLHCGGSGRRWFGLRSCPHCKGTGRRTTIRPIEMSESSVFIQPPVSKEGA